MSDKPTRSLSEIFSKIAPSLTGVSRDLFLEATDVRLKVSREARIAAAPLPQAGYLCPRSEDQGSL